MDRLPSPYIPPSQTTFVCSTCFFASLASLAVRRRKGEHTCEGSSYPKKTPPQIISLHSLPLFVAFIRTQTERSEVRCIHSDLSPPSLESLPNNYVITFHSHIKDKRLQCDSAPREGLLRPFDGPLLFAATQIRPHFIMLSSRQPWLGIATARSRHLSRPVHLS